ncbi:MAG: hypothetical protein E7058_09245 [Lentisphaerae bacterium]|nr:hypothetical protein [Lentisphaerota bacterium]
MLAPGESKAVEFTLVPRDFACFHPDLHHWCIPAGEYKIFLCRNGGNKRDFFNPIHLSYLQDIFQYAL